MLKFLGKKIIDEGVAPGCVLLAGNSKEILHLSAHGRHTYSDMSELILPHTMYDIASITKVITATAILILIDRGIIAFGDRLEKFFDCKYGKDVSIKHLLSHNVIIDAPMKKLAILNDPKKIEQRIMMANLACRPKARAEYRNVNAFLLGKVIEQATSQRLDYFFEKYIFAPLGMNRTAFNPPADIGNIAPSGYLDKRGFTQGDPHDPSAFALGGVAGHAGLFSTADDLYKFCRMWLNKGVPPDGVRFFSERLAEKAFKSHTTSDDPAFGLGWFLNCSWMGRYRKRITSHAGFTGCIINISRRDDLIVILLTNSTMKRKRGNFYIHNMKIMDKVIRFNDILNKVCRSSSFHPEKNMILSNI